MGFIKKTDCKLSPNNDNVNALSTYNIKSILLLMLNFSAVSSRCSWINIWNLL